MTETQSHDETVLVLTDFAAGTIGGMTGMVAGHPFDTAKTRIQAMPRFAVASTWTALRDTASIEGPRALYRGLSFPLASSALVNAIVFAVQGSTERRLNDIFGPERAQFSAFLAGCWAGFVQSPVVCTSELVKVQRQMQFSVSGGPPQRGPLALLQHRVSTLGVAQGCFQGFGVTCLREAPSYGIYFLVYQRAGALLDSVGSGPVFSTLCAGGLAGCISLGCLHPFDVVKSRQQALSAAATRSERSPWHIARSGLAADGAAFFLRGFGAAMLRAFVINSATFGGYELATSALKKSQ
eukprot:TRINITY_DN56877_c0_g1_i1.p1 TRINITY_DN56877_c0_g1~~TRINITY_DN56877_c0_g1_i1.p1  ORF type:complete len:296 (-),score=40.84 TRINITY_DN56877_c0_g1_i1:96-983(-)